VRACVQRGFEAMGNRLLHRALLLETLDWILVGNQGMSRLVWPQVRSPPDLLVTVAERKSPSPPLPTVTVESPRQKVEQ